MSKYDHLAKARAARGTARGAVTSPMDKVRANPKSIRASVNAKCYDCQGQDADPSWQWRVGNCTATDCPLYGVRQHQRMLNRPIPAGLRTSIEAA